VSPDPGLAPYWPGPWPAEDGGPRRLQAPGDGATVPTVTAGSAVEVRTRTDPVITMAVTRDPGELYLLRHTLGDDAESFVERIDPVTLEPTARSADLPGGAMWPGSIAAHGNGSLHVVFGNHAHRLGPDLELLASTRLPRPRPYNGFVVLPDGTLVTKDFAGSRPTAPVAPGDREACELVALDPVTLAVLDRCELAEPSIARLSALGDVVYVVGDTSLLRVAWNGGRFVPDGGFRAAYRTLDGQTYGWDCVLALGAAWFLDDGDGTIGFDGSFAGKGISTAPLHLVRVDLESAAVSLTEVCGLPGGLIANPPLIDPVRAIAVGYDSGNGVMAAFDIAADGTLAPRWRRRQNHASHLVLLPADGVIVTGDHDGERFCEQVVALDIATGEELVRADTGGPLQSTVFPSVGHDGTVYWCSMSSVSRVRFG
jgi:hypothetical protein